MIISVLAQSRYLFYYPGSPGTGQAPRVWKRDLMRQTDLLTRVLRWCSWISDLNQIGSLFTDQPLLGTCLEQLTARGISNSEDAATQPTHVSRIFRDATPKSESSPHEPRDQAFRSQSVAIPHMSPLPRTSRRIPNTFAGAAGVPTLPNNEQVSKVSELPLQVNESLLRRFVAPTTNLSRPGEQFLTPKTTVPVSRATSTAPVEPALTSRHWHDRVAQRAVKEWLRNWPSSTRRISLAPSGTTSLLESHWLTTLEGPMASAAILAQLAQRHLVSQTVPVVARKARSATGDNSTTARSRHFVDSAMTDGGGGSEPRHNALGYVDSVHQTEPNDLTLTHGRLRHSFGDEIGDTSWSTSGRPPHFEARIPEESASPPNIAASTVMTSLPTLLPSAPPGSTDKPIAAETMRQGAWRDEVKSQEKDLSLLAAQMKRILDEEARRHGIDV
jgi:hypothetical protein